MDGTRWNEGCERDWSMITWVKRFLGTSIRGFSVLVYRSSEEANVFTWPTHFVLRNLFDWFDLWPLDECHITAISFLHNPTSSIRPHLFLFVHSKSMKLVRFNTIDGRYTTIVVLKCYWTTIYQWYFFFYCFRSLIKKIGDQLCLI